MNKTVNYLSYVIGLAGLCLIIAFTANYFLFFRSFQDLELALHHFFQLFIILSPFPIAAGAYFTFDSYEKELSSFFQSSFSTILAFLILFTVCCLGYLLINDNLTDGFYDKIHQKQKVTFENRIAVEKDLQEAVRLFRKNDRDNLLQARLKFEKATNLFPYDIEAWRYLYKIDLKLKQQEIGPFNMSRADSVSRLEAKAIEYENERDYNSAIIIYKKILRHYPDKGPFIRIKDKYRTRIRRCQVLNRNPQKELADDELENINNRIRLTNITRLYREDKLFTAYNQARELYLAYEDDGEISATYAMVQSTLMTNRFILSEFYNLKRFVPNMITYKDLSFYFGEYTIKAKRIYVYDRNLYLENLTVINRKNFDEASYKYARILGPRMFLKNRLGEESDILYNVDKVDLSRTIHYLVKENISLLYFSSFIRMIKIKKAAVKSFFYHPFFYDFIINIKLCMLIFTITLFFLFLNLSFLNQKNLKRMMSYIFILFFSGFLYSAFIISGYLASFFGVAIKNHIYGNVGFILLNVMVMLTVIYQTSKRSVK